MNSAVAIDVGCKKFARNSGSNARFQKVFLLNFERLILMHIKA